MQNLQWLLVAVSGDSNAGCRPPGEVYMLVLRVSVTGV